RKTGKPALTEIKPHSDPCQTSVLGPGSGYKQQNEPTTFRLFNESAPMNTPSSDPAAQLLFSAAKALDPARHGHWKVRADANYSFARQLPTLPITAPEFVYAARDFPIVFAGEHHQPVIVTSFRERQNLLVDEHGRWRANRYVPLHLKRYPFILHEVPTEQRFA